jgi:hypothetical protein
MTKPELGITKWVQEIEPRDILGVGTFYDFFKRLWPAVYKKVKPKKQRKRKRKPKKGKKGEKAPMTVDKMLLDAAFPPLLC